MRFDLSTVVARASRLRASVDGVAINLPFVSLTLNVTDTERAVAREVVIRLSDKRVLNANECCDACISAALASLQDVRRILVDAQVRLQDRTDCLLYLVLEAMTLAIRQFLTFEQRLPHTHPIIYTPYVDALELLRAHLYRCLDQVAKIADITIPSIPEHMRYSTDWPLAAYIEPKALPGSATV